MHTGVMIFRRIASATIAVWRVTPSLSIALESLFTTVPGEIPQLFAICFAV